MSIKVAVRHKTEYRFDRPVSLSPHTLRLRPAPHSRTRIEAYSLEVEPEGHFLNWVQDPYNNYLARLVFPDKTRRLSIDVEVIADMVALNPFDYFLEDDATEFPFSYDDELGQDLAPYLVIDEEGPLLRKWLSGIPRKKQPTNDFPRCRQSAPGTRRRIHRTPRARRADLRGNARRRARILPRQRLATGADHAPHWGLPAASSRVTWCSSPPTRRRSTAPPAPPRIFSDLHAWTKVYLPGWPAGSGSTRPQACSPQRAISPLAARRHYLHAARSKAAPTLARLRFEYSNTVARIFEDPRVSQAL